MTSYDETHIPDDFVHKDCGARKCGSIRIWSSAHFRFSWTSALDVSVLSRSVDIWWQCSLLVFGGRSFQPPSKPFTILIYTTGVIASEIQGPLCCNEKWWRRLGSCWFLSLILNYSRAVSYKYMFHQEFRITRNELALACILPMIFLAGFLAWLSDRLFNWLTDAVLSVTNAFFQFTRVPIGISTLTSYFHQSHIIYSSSSSISWQTQ